MNELHNIKNIHEGIVLVHCSGVPIKEFGGQLKIVKRTLVQFFAAADQNIIHITDNEQNENAVRFCHLYKYLSPHQKTLIVISDIAHKRMTDIDFLGGILELLQTPNTLVLWFCDWMCFYEPLMLANVARCALYLRMGEKTLPSIADDYFSQKLWHPKNVGSSYERYLRDLTKTAILSYNLKTGGVEIYCVSSLCLHVSSEFLEF